MFSHIKIEHTRKDTFLSLIRCFCLKKAYSAKTVYIESKKNQKHPVNIINPIPQHQKTDQMNLNSRKHSTGAAYTRNSCK